MVLHIRWAQCVLRLKVTLLTQLLGIFTSYWVDYAVSKRISTHESKQWQIPIGLQLVPAALLGFGMLTLKESVRWLTKKGRHDEAWESLKWSKWSSRYCIAAPGFGPVHCLILVVQEAVSLRDWETGTRSRSREFKETLTSA